MPIPTYYKTPDGKKVKRMKQIIFFLTVIMVLIAGCNKDTELTVLQPIHFDKAPLASNQAVVITEDNVNSALLTLDWEAVAYPVDAPVSYFLQFTQASDTANWKFLKEMEVGTDILSISLTGEELNEMADRLGLEPFTENPIAIRVKSYLDRYAWSPLTVVNITPFEVVIDLPSLWVPGDYQGWNPATAPRLVSPADDGVYEGYIYIPEGGTYEFKITAQKAWEPIAYGDGGAGVLVESNNSTSDYFTAPSEGYYLLSVDLNQMIYLLMKTEWGIIGAATPGGWDADTEMTFDPETQVWSVTANMIFNGSFKFRANQAWQLDFGTDSNGNLAYANHPWKEYVVREELTLPADGSYTIILDLSHPGEYSYSIN